MISVILYGRNDAHGYNLHRRAALSLNCLAEVLADPDDEIVFVDYNTPDELPTFVEALADTLTDRCLGLLRVLRVSAAIHTHRFAARTHLPVIEPVARNIGIRRANPSNRWLLSTNTDMIVLPLSDQSLSDTCNDLPDAFYGLPRFELPEWLWEHLPRSDPRNAIAEIARLGPCLALDEPTVSHESVRFDAPGDFQLVLREDFFAIDGFDEEMVLGWHVDSNLSRRMFLHRGSIESLEERLAAYHCNHNRTPTIHHTAWAANDLNRFFQSVDRPELTAQREIWGLVDTAIDEVQIRQRVGPSFASAVLSATADGPSARLHSDARETKFSLEYDSSHVLPFVADSLVVSPPDTTIAYIGANPSLEEMLAQLVTELGLGRPLAVADLVDLTSVVELDRIADVFVVDLGIDASLVDASLATTSGYESAQCRARLMRGYNAFRRVVELERVRLEKGEHPRRFVLVNSSAVFWNAYALAQLHCSHMTTHSRVRHATVKQLPDDDDATRAADVRSHRLFRWIARRDAGAGRLRVHVGETVDFADLDDYAGFGEGWAFPDKTAVWTQGLYSELSIALYESCEGSCLLTLAFDEIGVQSDDSLRVDLLANGARIATRDFSRGTKPDDGQRLDSFRDASRQTLRKPVAGLLRQLRSFGIPGVDAAVGAVRRLLGGRAGAPKFLWSVELPAYVLADGKVDLAIMIEEPAIWSDKRRLGLHLRSFALGRRGWRQRLGRFAASAPLGDVTPERRARGSATSGRRLGS